MNMVTIVSEENVTCSKNGLLHELAAHNETVRGIVKSSRVMANVSDISFSQTGADELYLIRLHKEDADETASRVDLTGWQEVSRELCWAEELLGYNYSIIRYNRQISDLSISVILSTCNQPEWLEKVLWGYEAQLDKNFELIIADDGSRKETYLMLQRVVPQLSFVVKHVWHEDKGFRKCDILNKGILASQTDYLLFSDGDCIPRADFVSTHLRCRCPGRFLSGGYHKLSMDLSKNITKEDILSGHCFDLNWLRERGMHSSFKNNKLTATGMKRWLLNTFTPTKASWNGHGSSGWLTDIVAVNGFDERMQYGGQDREFGERLENRGIHGMQIRYSTICLHLDHARGYKTQESIQKNINLRKYTRGQKIKWSPCGIVKDEMPADLINIDYFYNQYTQAERELADYRKKGGIYRHLYSLPCRRRKAQSGKKVIELYRKDIGLPVLRNHSGIIVSLTTFPPRVSQLYLVLKSILWQTCQPERIVLWLSEEDFPDKLDSLPETLKALVPHGVEIRFVPENLRSHKKYHYAFKEFTNKTVITIDDDLIYPRDTVERLVRMSWVYPQTVCANVIRQVQLEGKSFAAYKKWSKQIVIPMNSSLQNMAVGCGGILYPPSWFDDVLFDVDIIRERCPAADDLWLKANELKQLVKVTGGGAFFPHPVILPQTQQYSLQRKNNGKVNLNDRQWASLNEYFDLYGLYLRELRKM